MSLKSVAKKTTTTKKTSNKKPEILVKGAPGHAIDNFVTAKKEIKRLEGDLLTHRPEIEDFAQDHFIKQAIEGNLSSSIKFRSAKGNTCTYIVQDRFSSSVFSDDETKQDYLEDLRAVLGKKADSLIETKEIYTINPVALDNAKVVKQLSKLAKKMEAELGEELLILKEKVSVKKGAMVDVVKMAKKPARLKEALAILSPVTQIRG